MTAFYARHFTKVKNESLEGLKILPEPVYGDEKDFTGVWRMPSQNNSDEHSSQNEAENGGESEKHSLTDRIAYYTEKVMDYTLFSAFPYVLLSIIFFSVIHFDGISFADLIDLGFLLQCFYILASIKSFYAKNVKMLSFLRKYNLIVLTILVVFQAPIFLCPVDQQKVAGKEADVFYVPASQCEPQRVQRVTGIEPWLTFYVVLA